MNRTAKSRKRQYFGEKKNNKNIPILEAGSCKQIDVKLEKMYSFLQNYVKTYRKSSAAGILSKE